MKSKQLKIGDLYRYVPSNAMVSGPRAVGWFHDGNGDKDLRGSLVKILKLVREGVYYGVFIETPGKILNETTGHFVEECLVPVMDDRRISMRPWNKPHV